MLRSLHLSKEVRQLLLFAGIVFLLFFRAKTAMTIYGHEDDHCYVEWLFRALGEVYEGCRYDHYYPGVIGLWLPAGFIAKALSTLTDIPLTETVPALVGVSSFFIWVGSLLVLWKLMSTAFPEKALGSSKKVFWTIVFMLNVPVIYYGFVRSTLTHSVEWLLALSFLLSLERKKYGWGLFFALWLGATRINDAFVFAILAMSLLESGRLSGLLRLSHFKKALVGTCVGIASLIVFIALKKVFITGYGGTSFLPRILANVTGPELYRVFFGVGGLAGTHTSWLVFCAVGTVFLSRLSWTARVSLAWLWLLFFVCAGWGTPGGSFGYRYLIGSYIAIWMIWRDLSQSLSLNWGRFLKGTLIFSAVIMSVYAWVFWTRFYMTPWAMGDWWWKLPGSLSLVALGPLGVLGASILSPFVDSVLLKDLKIGGFPFYVLLVTTAFVSGAVVALLKKPATRKRTRPDFPRDSLPA